MRAAPTQRDEDPAQTKLNKVNKLKKKFSLKEYIELNEDENITSESARYCKNRH